MEAVEYFCFLSGVVFGFAMGGFLFFRQVLRLREKLNACNC